MKKAVPVAVTAMAGSPLTAPPAEVQPEKLWPCVRNSFTHRALEVSRATRKVLPAGSCDAAGSLPNAPLELESEVDSSELNQTAPFKSRNTATALLPEM